MQAFRQDLLYAFRQLRNKPGFTLTAVLTLALGIGAVSTVFSVAYGVLIDPFPYKDVHTLVTPKLCAPEWSECGWRAYTPDQFNEIVRRTDIFAGVTASTVGYVVLTGATEPERVRGNYITPNTFDVLGVQPLIGRATTADDVHPGHEEVALLSYRYWQAHYGGRTAVLGHVLTIDGHPRTVIGIMPPRFLWRGADVYLPIDITNPQSVQGQRYFALVGRLRQGVTEAEAAAELKPIFNEFSKTVPFIFPKNLRLGILPFDEMFKSDLSSTLYLLLGSVFVLLLIACVNVSSMLLARAVQREHEFVVRASIGASRYRLLRYALTESFLLAVLSVPIALAFAFAGLQATLHILPPETIPDEAVITMNIPVLLAAIGIALLTVFLFGLAPAWHTANPRLAAVLNNGRTLGSHTQRRMLSGFVVVEIALSGALLMLAGLMIRSMIAVESAPIPFSPDHTVMMRIPLAEERYPTPESRTSFFRQLLDRVREVPGVKTATVDASYPFMDIFANRVQIGQQTTDKRIAAVHLTDPQYLAVSTRRMLQGHFLDEREIAEQAHEAVITENFAKRYFNGEAVLGRTIHLPDFKPDGKTKLKDDTFTIVGVMSDLPLFIGFREDYPHIFLPYTVAPNVDNSLIVSTILPAENLLQPLRHAVYSIDKDQPIIDSTTLKQMLDMYGYAEPRFTLALFGVFAASACLLTVIGIYGVISFITSQRTQEIGIRMALGADRVQVMRMVLRQALVLGLSGVAAGLPLSFFAGGFAKNELMHTSRHDPIALIAALCILPLLAVAGTYLPARRAAGIDPSRALRSE